MWHFLIIALVVLACIGALRRTLAIMSIRRRYAVNGALIGFSVAAMYHGLCLTPAPWFVLIPSASGLHQLAASTCMLMLLGGGVGALLGIRRDGTRYLFGPVGHIVREWRWSVIYHRQTAQRAKAVIACQGISPPTSTLILIYNSMFGEQLPLAEVQLLPGCALTTNRRYWRDAAAVVFHIPTLHRPRGLQRHPKQLWVAWFMESGVHYPILNDAQWMRQFDLTMSFRRHADIWTPYFFPDLNELTETVAKPKSKARLLAFFFSYHGEKSGRNTYVREFMKHIDAHSYGRFLRNRALTRDLGRSTKLDVLSTYKFNLAYENAIEQDYVTEKFFDPLEVGCVPVYMGAPNIDDYAPGDGSYVHAADFSGPKALAKYLLALNEDDDAYNAYLAWRHQPPRTQYLQLQEEQRIHPFVRLFTLVQNRQASL